MAQHTHIQAMDETGGKTIKLTIALYNDGTNLYINDKNGKLTTITLDENQTRALQIALIKKVE